MTCLGEDLEAGVSVNAGLCPAPHPRTLLVHLSLPVCQPWVTLHCCYHSECFPGSESCSCNFPNVVDS